MVDEVRTQQADRRLFNRATDMPLSKVTFSAGIADIFAFADAPSALRAADQALYRAKDAGRNCVMVADREAASKAEPAQ